MNVFNVNPVTTISVTLFNVSTDVDAERAAYTLRKTRIISTG